MPISTNGTVIARLAGGLYNTVLSNATYLEVATQDPSTLANTLYSRDFAKLTDLSVATTLLANLGLSAEAGLDAWVAAQLTAAGAANKGAKIVSLLNDFAGLTADAKWGTYATSFNTKVDAALAASQKDAAVTGVFATAGTVAVANATFTLTTSTDTGALFTGGAGDDTFNATNADLGVLDSIDGGAGTDTLSITDSVSIPLVNIKTTSVEKVVVNSTAGSVGAVAADAKIATKEKVTYTFNEANYGTKTGLGPVKVTVGGASMTVQESTATNAVSLSTLTTAINDLAGATIATTAGDVITLISGTAGTALPVVSFANGSYTAPGGTTVVSNTTIDVTAADNYAFKTTVVANQAAAAAVTASTFAVPTGTTSASLTAKTEVGASAPSTADVTAKGTVVKLSGGASQTITASNSVQASGSTGAVKITGSAAATTSLAAVDYTGWAEAAGIFVRGGSTVDVSTKAGAFTSGTASAANSKKIQIGSTPGSAYGASGDTVSNTTTTGYPTLIGNLADAPTGNVTTSVKTTFTDDAGAANITYGTGVAEIYMNGGTTASVTGAGAVTVRDMQSVATKTSSSATAAPAAASTVTTVNLTGVSGATGIYSDALTSVSVVDSSTTVTVNSNFGKNSTALNVSVGNSTTTVSASEATSVAVTGVQSANAKINTTNVSAANSASTLTLTAAKATTVSFAGTSDITLASSTLSLATSITASGSGTLDLGTPTGYAKVTKVDGSAATGKIIASIGATITGATTDHSFAFTGGSGADVVTISGELKADVTAAGASVVNTIDLGAGDDTIKNSSGTIGVGSTVDGGAGNDTMPASLVTVGNSARIKNFELLGLDKTSGSFDSDLLAGATGLNLLAQGGTYTNVEKTQSLTVNENIGSSSTTLTFTASNVTGKTDGYLVTFGAEGAASATASSPTAINAGTLVIEGIEDVTIASGAAKGYVNNTVTLTDANLKSVTVTGAATKTTLAFAGTNGTSTSSTDRAVSTIDGSAYTGRLFVNTANVVEDAVNALTVKGGSGKDQITFDGKTIVDAGAGDDLIIVSNGATGTVTGGAGADTFDVSGSTAADVTSDATIKYVEITDFAKGDVLKMSADTAASAAYISANTVVAASNATTLKEALTAALTRSTLSTAVTDANVYFSYGGNTFVAHQDSSDGFGTGDAVVKLTGIHVLAATNVAAAATGLFGEA